MPSATTQETCIMFSTPDSATLGPMHFVNFVVLKKKSSSVICAISVIPKLILNLSLNSWCLLNYADDIQKTEIGEATIFKGHKKKDNSTWKYSYPQVMKVENKRLIMEGKVSLGLKEVVEFQAKLRRRNWTRIIFRASQRCSSERILCQ